jgi:hypothetical protein
MTKPQRQSQHITTYQQFSNSLHVPLLQLPTSALCSSSTGMPHVCTESGDMHVTDSATLHCKLANSITTPRQEVNLPSRHLCR